MGELWEERHEARAARLRGELAPVREGRRSAQDYRTRRSGVADLLAVQGMAEVGVSNSGQVSKILDPREVLRCHDVVAMGCGAEGVAKNGSQA